MRITKITKENFKLRNFVNLTKILLSKAWLKTVQATVFLANVNLENILKSWCYLWASIYLHRRFIFVHQDVPAGMTGKSSVVGDHIPLLIVIWQTLTIWAYVFPVITLEFPRFNFKIPSIWNFDSD